MAVEITAEAPHGVPLAESPVLVTPRAARRVAEVLAAEPVGARLRVGVDGGGCSGFSYRFAVDRELAEDDILLLRQEGAEVVVDAVSLPFLQGAVLDFVDDLMGRSFRVQNPNATASCGCGTSFSV